MGRKNRRRGCRELAADLIAEILQEKPSQPLAGQLSQGESLCEETAADRAYTHAAEVCDRIVEELDKELRRMDHVRSRESG